MIDYLISNMGRILFRKILKTIFPSAFFIHHSQPNMSVEDNNDDVVDNNDLSSDSDNNMRRGEEWQ